MPKVGKWKVRNGSGQPAIGSSLDGLHIEETSNHFQLHGKLASVQKNTQNQNGLPVTFTNVLIDGATWDITVNAVPNTTNAGTWRTPSSMTIEDVPPQSGEFTAQSDGSPAEETAAVAGHGKQ